MKMNKRVKGLIEIIIIIALFVLASYLVENNLEYLENFLGTGIFGVIIFILVEITSIVIAPVTTLPLIAVASKLWGGFFTGIISILAWTIGSWIAFILGRTYGYNIIKKFIPLTKINEIEKKISRDHLFWSVVLLRMILPVDILSYAIGIFTKMKTRSYIIATIIGITPFAFVFAYLGTIPFNYQIRALFVGIIIILTGWLINIIYKKKGK